MQEFLGTHTPRLDDKGRLFLPARYRADLSEGLVITTGQENCLYVFPTAEFHRISAQMAAAPSSSKNVRDLVRVFRARAHSDTPDRQGRVTIPAPLRAYAGLRIVAYEDGFLEDPPRFVQRVAAVRPQASAEPVRFQLKGPGARTG